VSNSRGNEQGFNLSYKDSFNLAYVGAKAHAMCFLPFFRRNFGNEALGWPCATAFILMLLVGEFCQIPEMMGFMGFWMIVVLGQRASTMRQFRQGVIRHSRYEGDTTSRLIRNPSTVKRVVEPLVCVLGGVCIEAAGVSHGLAVFVGMGAFSLAFVAGIDKELDDKRVQAMRDAAIQQSYLAARFRGELDDN
jgi:hypothetical protein